MNGQQTRIYLVERTDKAEKRLVRAGLRHQAERHVVKPLVKAHVATKDELVELISAGTMVETANGADDAEAELPGIEP